MEYRINDMMPNEFERDFGPLKKTNSYVLCCT